MSAILESVLDADRRAQACAADAEAALMATANSAIAARRAAVARTYSPVARTTVATMRAAQQAFDDMAEPEDEGPDELEIEIEANSLLYRQPETFGDWIAMACTNSGQLPASIAMDMTTQSVAQLVALLIDGDDRQSHAARYALRDLYAAAHADILRSLAAELRAAA